MFESLDHTPKGSDRKTWLATAGVAVVLFGGAGSAALSLIGQKAEIEREVEVDVTFVPKAAPPAERPAETPPPPPPAAPPPPAPRPAAVASAPSPRPAGGTNGSKRKAFQAPRLVPRAAPSLADPVRVAAAPAPVAMEAAPVPSPVVVEAPPPPTVAAPVETEPRSQPISELAPFEPPLPADDNAPPVYPPDALRGGREGTVVIELRVTTDGSVKDVRVVSGDEPFVSAALSAVKTWRYTPPRVAGRAVEIARRVRLPFKVRS